MDDKTAFEDICKGGQSGYTVLYKRYVKSLRYYMMAKHNIPEKSVEDVLQKTFIKFFDSLPLNCLKMLTLQAQGASIEEISKKIERTLVATRRYLSDCRKSLKQYQPIQWCRELLNKH